MARRQSISARLTDIAAAYSSDIAGCLPDLLDAVACGSGRRREPSRREQRDAVEDFAAQWMFDNPRNGDDLTYDERRIVARLLADQFVGR